MPCSGPSSLVGIGPWAAVYVAPGQYSKNNRTRNRSTETTKNEIQDESLRDDVPDLTRHGPKAWRILGPLNILVGPKGPVKVFRGKAVMVVKPL